MKKIYYFLVFWILPVAALAAGGTEQTDGAGGSEVTPGDAVLINPLAADNIPDLLNSIINFLLALAAPIATIMAIYAGYLLIIAGDNENRVKTARQTILYVVLGVMVLILSKGIVSLAKSFLK